MLQEKKELAIFHFEWKTDVQTEEPQKTPNKLNAKKATSRYT